MKLLLVVTFLAFACIALSAPPAATKNRVILLPEYENEDEHTVIPDDEADDQVTTTTPTTTTRRTTYVFPTRNRNILSSRRPWLTQRSTSTSRTTTYNTDAFDDYIEDEGLTKYFKNFTKYMKQIFEAIKKFFRNINGQEILQVIQRFLGRQNNNDDD